MNIFNLSLSQIIILWIADLWISFIFLCGFLNSTPYNYGDSGKYAILTTLTPILMLLYTISWKRNNK